MFHPTLRDVAADAGVSHMTVSRVLRDVSVVSQKTAARVKASIARLGYRPDPALSSLAHRRRRISRVKEAGEDIVFFDCDRSDYTKEVAAAAVAEAAWFGHKMQVLPMPKSPEERRALSRKLINRGVEGVIIGSAPEVFDFTDWEWDKLSAVAVGILPHRPAIHAVSVEYFEGFLTAESGLRQAGERPGLCLRASLNVRSGKRWTGANLSCSWLPPPLIFKDDQDLQKRVSGWRKRHGVTFVLTLEFPHEPVFRAAGLKVGYLGNYDAPPGAAHLSIDTVDLGREATRLLHRALLQRDFGPPRSPQIVGLRARWIPAADMQQPHPLRP